MKLLDVHENEAVLWLEVADLLMLARVCERAAEGTGPHEAILAAYAEAAKVMFEGVGMAAAAWLHLEGQGDLDKTYTIDGVRRDDCPLGRAEGAPPAA